MSAIGEPTVVSETLSNMSAIEEKNSMDMSELTEKTKKAILRQKLMAIHARIKYRDKVIKAFSSMVRFLSE